MSFFSNLFKKDRAGASTPAQTNESGSERPEIDTPAGPSLLAEEEVSNKPESGPPGVSNDCPDGAALSLNEDSPAEGFASAFSGLVVHSKEWYVDQSRRLFQFGIFLGGALFLSLLLNIYQIVMRPAPLYFATTPEFQVVQMQPLSEPVATDQSIVNWTADVVTQALSLDFLHWQDKLALARPNFDAQGYQSFVNSLQNSETIKRIQDERLNLSCVLRQAAIITHAGEVKGRMTWRVEVPIIISYQSSRGVVSTQNMLVKALVHRVPTDINPKGVAIAQIVLTRA